MSGAHVLADMGPMRVSADAAGSQWAPEADGEDSFPSDEFRFHSLDDPTDGHRSSWTEGFNEEAAADGQHGVPQETGHWRRSHPSLGFRRRMSPARLHVVSDVTRLRHRSSSGGRRYSDTTTTERPVSAGLGGLGQGQGRLLRLSRDATQPTSGSVSDLRRSIDLDVEESDVLPALGGISGVRPRAFTCPDIKAMQRRTKIRMLHRPPTPTPGGDEPFSNELALELEKSCSLSNSGDIFAHDEEEDLLLPVISET